MNACIIVGNGPSACNLPAEPGLPLIGMNYSPITPDYYVCVDTEVLTRHWQKILPLAERARVAYLSGLHVGSSPLYKLPNVELIYKDIGPFRGEQFLSGMTAAYVALKCAYYLGFDVVHLWGVDHSTRWDHYRPDYPPPARDSAQRMRIMEIHYTLAAGVYARAGRRIINHSNPSRLDMIFERAKVEA